MDINYKQMADRAVAHAKAKNDVDLDFSQESLKKVDDILGSSFIFFPDASSTSIVR